MQQPLGFLLADAFADRESLSLVISSATRWRGSVAKRTSRLVRMPTSLPAVLAAALDHRNAGNPVLAHQRQRVGERGLRVNGDRVDHHAGFELLHLPDLGGLLAGRDCGE